MILFNNIAQDLSQLIKKDYIENDSNEESYKLYNKAIEMTKSNCYKSAKISLNMAYSLNNNDEDILNLLGMLSLMYCDFDNSCEKFYKSYEIDKNDIANKYIEIFVSEEFEKFINLYNRGIILINDGEYTEAIEIFKYIGENNKNLIEVDEILYQIYNAIGDKLNSDKYLQRIKINDKENDIIGNIDIYNIIDEYNVEDKEIIQSKKTKKIYYIVLIIFIIGILSFVIIKSKSRLKLDNKIDSSTNLKQSDNINQDEITNNKDNLSSKDNDSKGTYINIIDLKKEQNNKDESELMEIANEKKKDKDYIGAIDSHIKVIKSTENQSIISESLFQLAVISEKIGRLEDAKKYYLDYITLYSVGYPYYDESYYNLAMIYYNEKDLSNSKKYLKELIVKNPDSIYNNSKVKSIIKD